MDWFSLFRISDDFTVWSLLNSQALGTLATLFAGTQIWSVARQQSAKKEADAYIEEARQRAIGPRPSISVPEPSERTYNEEGRQVLAEAKAYIESQMRSDPDGRHQRTYEGIIGQYPEARAWAMGDRKRLSAKQVKAADDLFSPPYSYGRVPSNWSVTLDELERLKLLLKQLKNVN